MGSQLPPALFLVCVITGQTRGSLRLTTFPTRITEGNTYTLMCSSSAGSRNILWSRNSDLIVRTRYVSATQCAADVVNPTASNTSILGRINTSCEFNQHNVTLRISAQKDNGSVWWCVDLVMGDRSNNISVDVVNAEESTAASPVTLMTSSTALSEGRTSVSEDVVNAEESTAASPLTLMTSPIAPSESRTFVSKEVMTVRTTSSPTSVTSFINRTTSNTDTPNVVYVVIEIIGGAVVGCVITAAVVIAWMKKRHIRREDNINTTNIYDSASHYDNIDHQYGSVEKTYVNTVEGTETDTPDYVNTD